MAYYALEPFGEARADFRMAILASLIANANRDPKKHSEPFTAADFMPVFDEEQANEPKQSWEVKKAMMMALTSKKS